MAESGRIPVPLRLCRGCRRFVRLDGREDCAFCGTDLDAADAEHEANVLEMRRAAQALREALASLGDPQLAEREKKMARCKHLP